MDSSRPTCAHEQECNWYHLAYAVLMKTREPGFGENIIEAAESCVLDARDKKKWPKPARPVVRESAFFDLLALHVNFRARLAFSRAFDHVRKVVEAAEQL